MVLLLDVKMHEAFLKADEGFEVALLSVENE